MFVAHKRTTLDFSQCERAQSGDCLGCQASNLVKAPPCDLLEKWAQMYFKCFIPLLGTPSAPVFQRLIPASHMIVIAEQLLTNLSKSWQHQHSAVCRRQQSGLVNKILRQLDGLDLRGIYPAGLLELKSCCRPITFAAAVLAAP